MKKLNICFKISPENFDSLELISLEKNYQQYFKHIISFLYANPRFPLVLSFSGSQLEYYQKKHPEALKILSDLVSRRQIEILGGSYYLCIFPLLLSADRSSQIEKMSGEIRAKFGKRPRGISLFGDIWDPMLITNFQSCGFDYVILDKNLIPCENKNLNPIITNYLGKSIKVIPSYSYNPNFNSDNIVDFIKNYTKISNSNISENNSIFTLNFSVEEFYNFMQTKLANSIVNNLKQIDDKSSNSKKINQDFEIIDNFGKQEVSFEFLTCQNFLKKAFVFENVYIPSGLNPKISRWIKNPFQKSSENTKFLTIYDYLNSYPQDKALFERMMYVSMFISQSKGGDKIRKISANEYLLKAQSGLSFINAASGLPSSSQKMQYSYKNLNEAERLIRDSSKSFKESLTSYDYNNDGLNEYICQMEKYHAIISLLGGQISEFEIIKSGSNGNYCANLSRLATFDNFSDFYKRGFFVEHFFEKSQFDSYIKNNLAETDFSQNILYTEKKFESKRKEIYLEGKTEFSSMKLPLTVRKNYIITSNGISVQFILKNESPIEMSVCFAVEFNFAQICSTKEFEELYKIELIQGSQRKSIDKNDFCVKDDVSFVQVTSVADKVSFILEPNEDSGLYVSTLNFLRPQSETLNEVSKTLVNSLFWNITIPPRMEKEKTINLSIISTKTENKK